MKIGSRLSIGFAIAITGLIICNIIAIFSLINLNNGTQSIVKDSFPKVVQSNNMIDALNDNARAIRNMFLTDDAQEIKLSKERMDKATIIISDNLKMLEETITSESDKATLVKVNMVRSAKYLPVRQKILELWDAGKRDESKKLLLTDMRDAQNEYIVALQELIDHQTKGLTDKGKEADATYHETFIFMIIISVAIILLSIFIAIWIIRSITKPLSKAVIAAEEIAKGNMEVDLATQMKDETAILLNSMKKMAESIKSVITDTEQLSKAAINGKLDTRADAGKHQGDFGAIIRGINGTLDAVIAPLNVAAEYIDRISKGDMPPIITDTYQGDFNEIKNNLNQCINSLNAMGNDAQKLVDAAKNGNLSVRADASIHTGMYKQIVQGVNDTLDNVIGPLNVSAEYVDRISKGDMPPIITDTYKGDFNEIKNNLNQCINSLNAMGNDAQKLVDAAKNGNLSVRADASIHTGMYKQIVQGVNDTLDNVIGPLNVSAEYVDRISKGDMPPIITDTYKGDFNEIKNNLNQCINSLNAMGNDAQKLVDAAKNGNLSVRADASIHTGMYKQIVQGVNDTLDNVIGPLNVSAEYVDRISKGDMPPIITDTYKGDFNEIKNNLNQCINSLNAMGNDAQKLVDAAKNGNLSVRADASIHTGMYKQIVQGVNDTLDNVIGPLNVSAEYVDRISKGDMPPIITDTYKGDFNEIKNNLNQCINSLNAMGSDAQKLVDAAKNGNLSVRADASIHTGMYKQIVQGVNDTLDNVIGPLNVSAEYVDRISKGDMPPIITDTYKGDFNEIKNNLNQCINSLNAMGNDAQKLVDAAKNGNLSVRADASIHTGMYKQIVQGVNDTLDNVIGPLNVSAEYVDRISKGDMPPIITDTYKGDFNEIKNNLNQCINSLNAMGSDAQKLVDAAKNGNLSVRADASIHTGMYKQIVQGVNDTLDNVIGPLNVSAEYVDRISKGDMPPIITDTYKGDFNEIKNNLNQCINSLNAMGNDAQKLVDAAKNGNLSVRADASIHTGMYKQIVQGVNDTLDNVIGPINVAAKCIDQIAKGEIPAKITDKYNGDFNLLKDSLNQCIDGLDGLEESKNVLNLMAINDYSADINGQYAGIFADIAKSVNKVNSTLRDISATCINISKGDLGELDVLLKIQRRSDNDQLIPSLILMMQAIRAVVDDSTMLGTAAANGDLLTRADVNHHGGDFRAIVESINYALDNITAPINEAFKVLETYAAGDLSARMIHEYKGEFETLRSYINSLGDSLSGVIRQVLESVQSAASAAIQISTTADTMATSAEEQSSQADEVASAVEEMTRTIAENASSAIKTAQNAERNRDIAIDGGSIVEQTVVKMRDIAIVVRKSAENIEHLGESSKQIGEIISVIDDIADQTNLLALNAAIEAARAGEQGRGFAVVADEVRKLAERTTEATKQIANMIKGIQSETQEAVADMKKGNDEVSNGISLADKAGKSLKVIVDSSQDVQDMINQIAAATEEQSSTSEQIAKNVNAISSVTADSAKRIQDIAHSSDELAKLTENLREIVSQFKVEGAGMGYNLHEGNQVRRVSGSYKRHLPEHKI